MDTQCDEILTRHRRSVAPTASLGPHKPSSDLHSSFHWIHTVEKLKSQLKSVNEDLSRTRTVNVSLQMALEKSQKECAEHADTIKCLEYSSAERNPAEKTLYYQERHIAILKRALEEKKKRNTTFSKLSSEDHYAPKQEDIEKQIFTIHYQIKKILHAYDDNLTLKTPNLEHEDDLQALLRRSLGVDLQFPMDPDDLPLDLARIGLQAVICALTAAAVCE